MSSACEAYECLTQCSRCLVGRSVFIGSSVGGDVVCRHEPFLHVVRTPYPCLCPLAEPRPARRVDSYGNGAHLPWLHLPRAYSQGQLAEGNEGKGKRVKK